MTSSTSQKHPPLNVSRTSATSHSRGSIQAPALQGAYLAFQTPPAPPKPLVNTHSGREGALAAAAKAGKGLSRRDDSKNVHTPQKISFGNFGKGSELSFAKLKIQNTSDRIRTTSQMSTDSSRKHTPSHIAATVAAARSIPSAASIAVAPVKPLARAYTEPSENKDESPILATNTLVRLYESKYRPDTPNEPIGFRVMASSNSIASPTPIRPSISLRLSSHTLNNLLPTSVNAERSDKLNISKMSTFQHPTARSSSPIKPISLYSSPTFHESPPFQRESHREHHNGTTNNILRRQSNYSVNNVDSDSASSSYVSALDTFSRKSTIENTFQSKPRRTSQPNSVPTPSALPNNTITLPPLLSHNPSFRHSIGSNPMRPTLQLTASSLANAIVASSLASSRAPSPTKISRIPPLPRRHSKHSFFHHDSHSSRTPSPPKGLRHTMRGPVHSSDEETPHAKRPSRIIKKHPHKHAEGDRKRWRDVITERERKRYEGLWAANRGVLVPPLVPDAHNCVHGLVVKDIWSRSQLSKEVLTEIWELVDRREDGVLERQEFVVGLWLVDQCLKGRKLPVQVSESVWGSVRVLTGIMVGNSGKKRR